MNIDGNTQSPQPKSIYAKVFDQKSPEFRTDPEYNLMFLNIQQRMFNNKLNRNGHVFLNEVHDALGLPRTAVGAVVGWMKSSTSDNYIDFDILPDPEKSEVIMLDFNVDGIIVDQLL